MARRRSERRLPLGPLTAGPRFLVYLGYSKHLHIITAPFNVFFSSTASRPRGALKPVDVDFEEMGDDDVIGAATITDLTWKGSSTPTPARSAADASPPVPPGTPASPCHRSSSSWNCGTT